MNRENNKYLYLIFIIVGFIFLRSGWGKVTGGKFVATLGGTLTKFASENPYPWYKSFLQNIAIPNSYLFGILTMWGEVLVGLSLTLVALYLLVTNRESRMIYMILMIGFLVGMFLNGTFWLAAGWTSPSTESVNLVMFGVETVGFIFTLRKLSTIKV